MKNITKYLLIILIGLASFIVNVYASSDLTYINIKTSKISTDGKKYTSIKKYDTLDEFLKDYKANKLPEIYLTSFLFDGVSSVKSPDLDDFIDEKSNDIKIKTLKINVLNINTIGNIELTGAAKEFMIAVNTNGIKGELNIILNNVNIDTDTKKAPAIYVYNKDITYTDCKVTIKAKKETENYIEGGKFKKVSLMPKDDLDSYKSLYTSDALTNFENYSSYYGIYSKEELDNILFASVKADNEGLREGDPYLFYKGSGAISSDIDLYFEGEGYLKVSSKNKEGIETKGNLIFSGGIGDYEILAYDDCLNTTTSSSKDTNVRNDLIIDVNSLIATVNDDGDEGDAIDSNGSLTINGGNIYAFAHSNSGDAGLDSETGVVLNGGTIIATGNMADAISNSSKEDYVYVKFNAKISKNTLIVITDENDKIITAFKTDKDYQTLLYSSEDLAYKSFKIYSGGSIDGEEINGLYTTITNYEKGDELEYSTLTFDNFKLQSNKSNNFIFRLLICEVSALIILIIYISIDNNIRKRRTNKI